MEMVNEGIIPMNMTWRASMNNDDTSIYRGDVDNNISSSFSNIPNKGELYQSIIGEAMYIVHMFIAPYIDKNISDTELIIVKSSIQNKLNETIGRYRKFINSDFPDYAFMHISEAELNGVVSKKYILDCLKSYINPIEYNSPKSLICD